MLSGIIPIVFAPFEANGTLNEADLRRVVRFELEGGCDAIGVNGFATEAYKMSDAERQQSAVIVVDEVAGEVPVIIGIAPGSLEVGLRQVEHFSQYDPAALMTLPPATMQNDESALVEFYVELGNASGAPIMVQQSPHYPGFSGTKLSVESLVQIAAGSSNVRYFKIEGPGSPERIGGLAERVNDDNVTLFGGVGGIALQEELKVGAGGLLPGVGFNEVFVDVWQAWTNGDHDAAHEILTRAQPLVEAVSGSGHEYSLHVRKFLLKRAGIIENAYVRRPTNAPSAADLKAVAKLADALDLRISR